MRPTLLTVAASLCMLPHIQAHSVFNFNSDPTASYSTIGFVNVNNGISAAFYPGVGGLSVFTVDPNLICPGGEGCYYPLRTLSGNALFSGAVFSSSYYVSTPASFGVAFSSELASIQFNFAEPLVQLGSGVTATVQAYNNGVLVGSETTYGYVPTQDGPSTGMYAAAEGVGGFIGAPFNEVVISGMTGVGAFYLDVDNIDVSAAPEPLGLTAFGLLLVGTGVAYRRRRS